MNGSIILMLRVPGAAVVDESMVPALVCFFLVLFLPATSFVGVDDVADWVEGDEGLLLLLLLLLPPLLLLLDWSGALVAPLSDRDFGVVGGEGSAVGGVVDCATLICGSVFVVSFSPSLGVEADDVSEVVNSVEVLESVLESPISGRSILSVGSVFSSVLGLVFSSFLDINPTNSLQRSLVV